MTRGSGMYHCNHGVVREIEGMWEPVECINFFHAATRISGGNER